MENPNSISIFKSSVFWLVIISVLIAAIAVFLFFKLLSPKNLADKLTKQQQSNDFLRDMDDLENNINKETAKPANDRSSSYEAVNQIVNQINNSDATKDQFIKNIDLISANLEESDKNSFKQGALLGYEDGKKLNELNENYFGMNQFAAGHEFGYLTGCEAVKKDKLFCQNLLTEKLSTYLINRPQLDN